MRQRVGCLLARSGTRLFVTALRRARFSFRFRRLRCGRGNISVTCSRRPSAGAEPRPHFVGQSHAARFFASLGNRHPRCWFFGRIAGRREFLFLRRRDTTPKPVNILLELLFHELEDLRIKRRTDFPTDPRHPPKFAPAATTRRLAPDGRVMRLIVLQAQCSPSAVSPTPKVTSSSA